MMKRTNRNTGAYEEALGKDVYLYNLAQAQFFLDHGLCPAAVGRGTRGDVFLKFRRDDAAEKVFQAWNAYVRRLKERER